MNYQYQSKQMVVDALLKVVNASPNSQMQTFYSPFARNQPRTISQQEFITWFNYANSILDVSYNHTGLSNILSTKVNISQIFLQNNVPYEQRIESIKYELLSLARGII